MTLTAGQRDRACGALLGTAAGDALGAGYEFGPSLAADAPVDMIGGGLGPFKPGEWTDDTSMAIAIAEIAATGTDLRDEEAQDYVAERWHWWAKTAKDIGNQTSSVLSAAGRRGISAQTAREESAALHKRTGHTAGNGSLMRTAPVALAYLDDEAALVEAARAVSELTHHDPGAGDACVLWCTAIRHAILTGKPDARIFQSTKSQFADKREKKELPTPVKRDFIEDLLEDGVCICGAPLNEGTSGREHITAWRERAGLADVEQRWSELHAHADLFITQRNELRENLRTLLDNREESVGRLKHTREQLSELSRDLKGATRDDIAALENARVTARLCMSISSIANRALSI